MNYDYKQYLTKDSFGGATLKHYPGKTLRISESDLFALDIEYADQLEHLIIDALRPGKEPHLRLFNVPQLLRVDLHDSIDPAIVYHAGIHASDTFEVNGKIVAFDATFDNVGFAMEAASYDHWEGFRMLSPSQAASVAFDHHLLLVCQNPHRFFGGDLNLPGNNDWVLDRLDSRSLTLHSKGQVQISSLNSLYSIHLQNKCSELHIRNATNLQKIEGDGEQLKVHIKKHGTGSLNIQGEWSLVVINTPVLKKLTAPKIHELMVVEASKLETVELALPTEVTCQGIVPSPLSLKARYFFHEATLKNMIKRFNEGDTDVLATLLIMLPQAAYRSQARHSLNALKALCDKSVPAEDIWKARNELLLNNIRMYELGLYSQQIGYDLINNVPWHWTLNQDLYQEAILADLKIWDYCQKSLPAAKNYAAIMKYKAKRNSTLHVLIHCISSLEVSKDIYELAAELLESHSNYIPEIEKIREQANFNMVANRLLFGVKKARGNPEIQKRLIRAMLNLLTSQRFMHYITILFDINPKLVRGELVRICNAPNSWFDGFFTGYTPILSQKQNRKIKYTKQKLMLLALSPSKPLTTETALEAL